MNLPVYVLSLMSVCVYVVYVCMHLCTLYICKGFHFMYVLFLCMCVALWVFALKHILSPNFIPVNNYILKTFINGRNVYGTPLSQIPPNYETLGVSTIYFQFLVGFFFWFSVF